MTCQLRRLLPGVKAHDDARTELAATRAELDRVRRQWPDIHEVVERLKRHRERNGFSESIAAIYRGGRR
jgi:hypothetical protein